jgi:hypothetical protein
MRLDFVFNGTFILLQMAGSGGGTLPGDSILNDMGTFVLKFS